jgi:UDP-N-acetylglucosamine--N-acetylmuramyl-(pentapeptide) pyrophosphoryl-undecaprenol N-acetylglucosamine transferase
MDELREEGWEILYVGSRDGIERSMMGSRGVAYRAIATGKLRRYFDWQNFVDPFRILWGLMQSLVICLSFRPDVVFSKGGFVAVPVVVAAWLTRTPVISHESDMTPGLANKLCYPFSAIICVNFEETEKYLPAGKVMVTGSPVRRVLLEGEAVRGRDFLQIDDARPILLVIGGSLGAVTINRVVRESLDDLLERFVVVHVAGGGNVVDSLLTRAGYLQYEYIDAEFGDVLAASTLVLSRAGANSLYELLTLRKPHILVPLPLSASRGDQIVNARVSESAGMSTVIQQEDFTSTSLMEAVAGVSANMAEIRSRLEEFEVRDSVGLITDLIKSLAPP